MRKVEFHFKPSVFFTYLCWGCLLFVIEMFFVIAPITSSYIHLALVMMMAVGGAVCVFFQSMFSKNKLNFFLISYIAFHAFLTLRAILTGNARTYTDLLFYWSGMVIVICAASFPLDSDRTEKMILNLLTAFGLFFSVGIFLQMMFTDQFLRFQLPMLDSDYSSSLRRQVVFHQMYTGWTTQTAASCINLLLGIYGALLAWEREKKKRYLAAAAVMLVAFLLTGKRGPLLFMLFAFILTSVLISGSFDKLFRLVWKYILAGIVVAIGLVIYVSKKSDTSRNSIVRFMEMFSGTGGSGDDVSNGRFELWSLALRLFRSNPIWGIGWRRYHEIAFAVLHEDKEAHNAYLQVLAECGIIGFVLYIVPVIAGLVFTFLFLKRMYARRNSSAYRLMKLSMALQLFFLVYSMTGNPPYDYCASICYYFIYALCLYAANHSNLTWKEILQWIKL